MTNTFLDDTAQAMRAFDRASDRYHVDMTAIAAMEWAAWRTLLDVPGMTVSTAAALCDTSIATIHRRVKEAGHAD
ncbi:MAG: hypothetical protein Q7V58_03920 [Actinomycetota bacterium]|nr:hypothetical protein [Actinomycetota bacterium]